MLKIISVAAIVCTEVWLGFYLGHLFKLYEWSWLSIPYAVTFLLVIISTLVISEDW